MQRLDITTHTELHPLCHIQVIIMPDLQQKGDIHIDNTSLLWCNCDISDIHIDITYRYYDVTVRYFYVNLQFL